jgi:hypothetical protein
MDTHARQLPIPGPAREDSRALELLRVWAAGGKQHVSLATGIWDDAANWGIMLVDLAKHIANSYQQTTRTPHSVALRRLKEGFDAEWGTATDEPTGQIQE